MAQVHCIVVFDCQQIFDLAFVIAADQAADQLAFGSVEDDLRAAY